MYNNSSKKTIGLVVLTCLVLVLLVLIIGKTNKPFQNPGSSTPTPSYHADATIQLQLTQLGATLGKTTIPSQVAVNITSGTNHIRGAQFSIQYDPKYIQNVDIKPGPYLQNPLELSKKIDPKAGIVSYAIAVQPGTKASIGKGTIALISFQLAQNVTGTSTTMAFTGQPIIISADTLANVMQSSTNADIPLPKQ